MRRALAARARRGPHSALRRLLHRESLQLYRQADEFAPTPSSRASPISRRLPASSFIMDDFALVACLDGGSIRTLKNMLVCLDRFGKDLFLEANENEASAAGTPEVACVPSSHRPALAARARR